MGEREIRIEDLFTRLKNRWKVILSFTLISTAFAVIMSYCIIDPQYTTSTKLFIGKRIEENAKFSPSDIQVYQGFLKNCSEIIISNDFVKKALKDKELNINASIVLSGLKVTAKDESQVLQISYTSSDREMTKKALDAISDEFEKEIGTYIPNCDVRVIQESSVPGAPVSPNKSKNIMIGFFIGAMIGTLVAFWIEYINNTVKSKEDIEKIIGLPIVGVIPTEK